MDSLKIQSAQSIFQTFANDVEQNPLDLTIRRSNNLLKNLQNGTKKTLEEHNLPFLCPQKIAATRIPPTVEETVEMTRATYQSNGNSHSLVHLNNNVEQHDTHFERRDFLQNSPKNVMEQELHALITTTDKCTERLIYSHRTKNAPKKLLQRCRCVNEGIYSRINHFYQLISQLDQCSLNIYSELDAFKYQLRMIIRNSKRSLETIKTLMKEAIKFKLNVLLENMKCCNSKIVCYSEEMLFHCGSRPRNRKVHRSTCHAPNNMKTTLNNIQDDAHFKRRDFLQNSPKNAMEKKLHALITTNKCTERLIFSHRTKNVSKRFLQRFRCVNEGIYSRINRFYQCSLNTYSKLDCKRQLYMIIKNSKQSLKTIKDLMKEAIKFKLNVPLENMKYCNSKIVCYSKEMLLHCGSRPRNRKVHRSTCHAPNNMKTTVKQHSSNSKKCRKTFAERQILPLDLIMYTSDRRQNLQTVMGNTDAHQ